MAGEDSHLSYSWILFDLDGTLFDYETAERTALEELWIEAGFGSRADLLDTYQTINRALWLGLEAGTTSPDQIKTERFRRLLEALELDGNAQELSDGYLRRLGAQTHLLPGARGLLERLAGNRRLGLITNGLSQVQRPRLASSLIGDHFELFVISEEVGFAKPDPRIFELALARMGRPPKEKVLMVGDNPVADIEGANRFGLDTCWLNLEGNHDGAEVCATYEIRRLRDLAGLLEE